MEALLEGSGSGGGNWYLHHCLYQNKDKTQKYSSSDLKIRKSQSVEILGIALDEFCHGLRIFIERNSNLVIVWMFSDRHFNIKTLSNRKTALPQKISVGFLFYFTAVYKFFPARIKGEIKIRKASFNIFIREYKSTFIWLTSSEEQYWVHSSEIIIFTLFHSSDLIIDPWGYQRKSFL